MTEHHRLRGFGPKETMLAIAVLVIAVGILYPVARRTQERTLLLTESGRMRRLYIALSFYEEQHDAAPAPDLVAAAVYDPDRSDYLSTLDPFAQTPAESDGFPSDPGLDNAGSSPFRISFSYLQNFVRTGKLKIRPWVETRLDAKVGELADEWYGTVRPEQPFHATVSGRLLRVNTDGSVFVLPDRGGPKPLGDAQDLFVRR